MAEVKITWSVSSIYAYAICQTLATLMYLFAAMTMIYLSLSTKRIIAGEKCTDKWTAKELAEHNAEHNGHLSSHQHMLYHERVCCSSKKVPLLLTNLCWQCVVYGLVFYCSALWIKLTSSGMWDEDFKPLALIIAMLMILTLGALLYVVIAMNKRNRFGRNQCCSIMIDN